MALRRWRTSDGSGLAIEGVQTGDGRVIAAGALTFAPLPLPFAFLVDGDQHINLTEVAPQVGIIETLDIVDGRAEAGGVFDDEIPAAAELIRRMDAGTASHGNRQLVSIDPDDWQVQIIANYDEDDSGDEGGVILVASGRGPLPVRAPAPAMAGAVTAAAGDPDPGDERLLFEMSSDEVLERMTRLRVRGVTACAVSAFAECFVELEAADAAAAEGDAGDEGDTVAASAAAPVRSARVSPSLEWFHLPEPDPTASGMLDVYGMPVQELIVEQPDGSLGVPLTIVGDQVFGNLALWGTCHVGYEGVCVTPPDSPSAYAHFHVGEVLCADGQRIATGPLTVGCDHAPDGMLAGPARDHYANAGLGWADVRVTSGAFGPWVSGVLRPGVTEDHLRVLRALSLSGDWRRIGGSLELIAGLAVNVPGFPIAREHLVASALSIVAAAQPRSHVADGVQLSLVASGIVHRCAECAQRRQVLASGVLEAATPAELVEALDILRRLDHRTQHLVPAAHAHVRERLGR